MSTGRRGGATWLAGWLFADLFLVLFLVFLADSARAQPEAKGSDKAETAPDATAGEDGGEGSTTTEPTGPMEPVRPRGLEPQPITIEWHGGQLAEAIERANTDQGARDYLIGEIGKELEARQIIGKKVGIALVFTNSGRKDGNGKDIVDSSWSNRVAGVLCEAFDQEFEAPAESLAVDLDRCGDAQGRIRPYYTGGVKGDLELVLWVYEQ